MSYIKYLRGYVGHNPIMTAGTGVLIFNEKRELLLQLRSDTNTWGVPGGSMELGESFEETAIREVKEETTLIIQNLKLIHVLSGKETFRTYPNGDQLYDITAIFEVTSYEGEPCLGDEETKQLQFFSLEQLPTLVSMSKTIIEEYIKHTRLCINKE